MRSGLPIRNWRSDREVYQAVAIPAQDTAHDDRNHGRRSSWAGNATMTLEPTPARVAERDQWLKAIDDLAVLVHDAYEAFLRSGFNPAAALELTAVFLSDYNHDSFHRREM